MYCQYGKYVFAQNTTFVTLRQRAILNAAQSPYMQDIEVDVQGRLYGTSQADISSKCAALEATLKVPYQNFGFYQDNGSPTDILLVNNNTLSGVIVKSGPDFTSRVGAEYVNQREYMFTVNATLPIYNAATALFSYRETMNYSGGAPEYVECPAINGPSQIQLGWFLRSYELVQSGEAVGFTGYPIPPSPAYPANLKFAPRITRKDPERIGFNYIKYPIAWEYTMIGNAPILALPNIWK